VFWGRGTRIAIWISGNRHSRDRLASVIRWSMLTFGVLLTWLGSTIAFRQLGVGYPDCAGGFYYRAAICVPSWPCLLLAAGAASGSSGARIV